jgi:hypothetical protein
VEGELSAPPKPPSFAAVAMDYSRFHLVNSGHDPPLLVIKDDYSYCDKQRACMVMCGDQVLKNMISKSIRNRAAQFGVF